MESFWRSCCRKTVQASTYLSIGKKEGEQWFERHVNVWSMMEMHAPVRHVSALDAEHFCDAQGLRLPTEAQLAALLLSNPQN